MTTRLIAVSSRGPIREFVVKSAVVRLGSHPGCGVMLPEVEPHAVTLERREGSYVVHNRTQRVLRIESEQLSPNEQKTWEENQRLFLRSDLAVAIVTGSSGSEVALAQRGTSRATARVRIRRPKQTTAAESAGRDGYSSAVKNGSVAVFVLVLTFGVLSLVSPGNRGAVESEELARVVRALRDSDLESQEIAQQLQLAAQADWQGRHQVARVRYRDLRDRVIELVRSAQARSRRDPAIEAVLRIAAAKVL